MANQYSKGKKFHYKATQFTVSVRTDVLFTEENAYYVGLSLKYHEFLYVPQEASDLLIVAKFDSSEVAAKVCQILDRKKDNEKKR